jgi:hypothetical protein
MIGAKTIIAAEEFTIEFALEADIVVAILFVLKVGETVAEGKLVVGFLLFHIVYIKFVCKCLWYGNIYKLMQSRYYKMSILH